MDNPQHYQPLSHALHPPPTTVQPQSTYTPRPAYQQKPTTLDTSNQREDEEEDDDEEDEDEEVVEEQLNRNEPESLANIPSPQANGQQNVADLHNGIGHQATAGDISSHDTGRKRRPGRPRGSKNRKPRAGSSNQTSTSALPHHPEVNPQNQQYYEFQWRVLNLCAEFYTAAEELVKGTSPLVVAQCYQMGPGVKVDPLIMLGEAKRICDTLVISSPPPPLYPVIPALYNPIPPQQASTSSSTTSSSSTKPVITSSVITNPQSFVVPLGTQPAYPQYPLHYAPAGQYPTNPYYQYSAYHPTYYAQPPQAAVPTQPPVAATSPSCPSRPSVTSGNNVSSVNQGPWSEEETDRLKRLAEESKSIGTSGEIEWDWVVHKWGAGRTRHQILIKATTLGLKESTTRGVKRRRETEAPGEIPGPSIPPTPPVTANTQNPVSSAPSASPSQSASASESTPSASPAMQHQQRPPSSKETPSAVSAPSSSGFPYPMPTVARDIPSPVIPGASIGPDQQRTSYYRPRPNQPDSSTSTKAASTPIHHYMYQPNGGLGSRSGRENGK
ncbi:hypothetical protein BDQ17DRAFT_1245258 [Cyathus striatus]|nr:hypothetical protein BDQ17DRAFT_1245258 [Cyathus striatus]